MSAPLLTERFARDIKGAIECFDRIVLFGTYGSVVRSCRSHVCSSLSLLPYVRNEEISQKEAKAAKGLG